MPTVLSKPVLGDGSLSFRPWAPKKEHQIPCENRPTMSQTNIDLSNDEAQLPKSELEAIRTQAHMDRLHHYVEFVQSVLHAEEDGLNTPMPGAPNHDESSMMQENPRLPHIGQAIDERPSKTELPGRPDGDESSMTEEDLELLRIRKVLDGRSLKSEPDLMLPPPLTLTIDKSEHLEIENGQMKLLIYKWKYPMPDFVLQNKASDNPKTGLEVVIAKFDFAIVKLKMALDFPGGMTGFLGVFKALLVAPELIGMTSMEAGSEVVNRESRNPEKSQYHIKWTTPWETDGCRVSWMKEKENSTSVRFKFVNTMGADPEEKVLISVDEQDDYYQSLSQKDPNLYGRWMAMPVRIWLHTQRVLSEHGPMENDFFNKLPVNGNSPTVSKKKAKGKGRREKKKSSKAIPSEVAEGPEEPEDLEATKSIETPEGSDNKESEIEPATVPNPEPSVLEGEVNPAPVNNQEHLPKKPPTLRIDTTTGNMRWKHKRAAGSDGVINPEHVHKLTHERGHSHPRLFTTDDPTSLLTQFAPVPGQESTKNASLSPIHSSPMPASSTSFKTARSQVTPHTSLSSSAPPKFLTPISAPLGKSKEDIEAQTGTPEPQPSGEQDPVTPNLCETEIQHPVLKVEEEPCVSDPEECTKDSKALKAMRLCEDSPDVMRLGIPKGLEENTPSPPMANPPLTTSASCEQATADTSSTKLTTEQPISDATVGESSQDQATERKLAKLSALKRKKNERRKRRNRQRREEARAEADAEARAEADAEASVQAGADSNSQVHDQKPNAFPEQQHSAASSSHGVEGQTPSTPETSSSEELTPKAMQFGDIGASSSRMALDLTMLAVPCAKQDCGAVCGFKDGASVVCPKCGPYSMTRYCGQLHLWEDVKSHWVFCSTQTIDRPCLASSISADALVGPPMLPCLHQWDTPARHRQAVWFSSARHLGDYFIFADWTDPMTAGDDPASHMRLRCSPQVAFTVRFEDAREKDRFRRCLAICLFAAVEHPALVDYLYRLVRDWMRAHVPWASDNDVDGMLRDQMSREMGGDIHPGRVGSRHACETEWVGANRRHCEDPTCMNERPPVLLGSQCMGLGFQRVCEYLESKHWILRAHRTTHPSVSDVVARTCGGGYSEVLTVDRRLFRRGEGWDGAGTGSLELEWP